MHRPIPLATPTMNGTELDYVHQAFDTNWIAPLGPNVDAFEQEVVDYLGGGVHAAALSSGTAAIHLALKAVGVTAGDIVFCTDLTFAATCNPIIYEKAVPVFIDSEPESWNMCPKSLEAAFKKHPNPKAVLVVNLYGTPAKLDVIAEICAKHNVPMIEDAAESLGSTLHGKQTGIFGRIGIFSFNGNKIITTSGGGMLVSPDEDIVKKARFWATQSRDNAPHYQHSELGYNYRMSNVCAGIGRGQLTTLDLRVKQKTAIYNRYKDALEATGVVLMNPVFDGVVSNHWLSGCVLSPESRVNYTELLAILAKERIEGRPVWKPMSMQPFYERYDFVSVYDAAVSHDLFNRGLCLPSDVKMTVEEQERVVEVIKASVC